MSERPSYCRFTPCDESKCGCKDIKPFGQRFGGVPRLSRTYDCEEIEEIINYAYLEGREDEAAKWERVGYIGFDAAQVVAAKTGIASISITKKPLLAADVALWRKK